MNPIFDDLPTKLGLYTLTELLCSREKSELYAATQSYVDRTVVIEVLRPGCSELEIEHFRESAHKRATVTPAHVSPVLEAVQSGSFSYVVEEELPGKSLSMLLQEGVGLSYKQGFALAQAVAELYNVFHEQNMAAVPLDLASIYVDDNNFSFFSPLEDGISDDAQRVAQMTALADILEQMVPGEVLAKSKLAVVVHWLRNGYGGSALEWQPLLGALNSLRLHKKASERKKTRGILHYVKWRYVRRGLRVLFGSRKRVIFNTLGILIVAIITYLVRFFTSDTAQLQAVADDYVYCRSDGVMWRVRSKPVTIREYTEFLTAYNSMSAEEKQRLHAGMPMSVREHTPLDWTKQLRTARNSSVRGVSYWDALAFARYRHEIVPEAKLVRAVRKYNATTGASEEWTSSQVAEKFPLQRYYVAYPAKGEGIIPAVNPAQQGKKRSFRTARIAK